MTDDNDISPDRIEHDVPRDSASSTTGSGAERRPARSLLYWLRAVDARVGDELARAFAEEGPHGGEAAESVRTRISQAVTPEELAATVATLQAIAHELGWDDASAALPRHGRRGGHRFHPDHRVGSRHGRPRHSDGESSWRGRGGRGDRPEAGDHRGAGRGRRHPGRA